MIARREGRRIGGVVEADERVADREGLKQQQASQHLQTNKIRRYKCVAALREQTCE